MARILVLLPDTGSDPGEVALPWQVWSEAGHAVCFATQSSGQAVCDPITLTGQGLPLQARSLRARASARTAYSALQADQAWQAPLRWDEVRANDFDAIHFPGGHAPGMRPFCESPLVADLARAAFAADLPVSAICHGTLPLARAGVLKGRITTSLTKPMERLSIMLTAGSLPGHYQTYPEPVEVEVRRSLGPGGTYLRGPLLPRFSGASNPDAGFVAEHGNYVSGRWPGDSWTLALRLAAKL